MRSPERKPHFLSSSILVLPSECLQSNLPIPFAVATSDSPHSLLPSRLPSFQCFVTLSIPMQIPIITFFHSPSLPPAFALSRSYFQNLSPLAANPISFFSLLENWLCRKKGKRRRRLCFAGKHQRNNIRNQLCERGTKSTHYERKRRIDRPTDCWSIN